jgi:putative hemin transport protein
MSQVSDLAARWNALKESKPAIRARDAAEVLGVSEAELVASRTG